MEPLVFSFLDLVNKETKKIPNLFNRTGKIARNKLLMYVLRVGASEKKGVVFLCNWCIPGIQWNSWTFLLLCFL